MVYSSESVDIFNSMSWVHTGFVLSHQWRVDSDAPLCVVSPCCSLEFSVMLVLLGCCEALAVCASEENKPKKPNLIFSFSYPITLSSSRCLVLGNWRTMSVPLNLQGKAFCWGPSLCISFPVGLHGWVLWGGVVSACISRWHRDLKKWCESLFLFDFSLSGICKFPFMAW